MSIREVTMYVAVCDRCGRADADTDYCAWADVDQAEDAAADDGWLIRGDGHWCIGCTLWDEESGERLPAPAEGGTEGTGAP